MLAKRFNEMLKALQLTHGDFAKQVDIKLQRARDLCAGRVKRLLKEEADTIALTFGVSQQWLINGHGQMWLTEGEWEAQKRLQALSSATSSALALAGEGRRIETIAAVQEQVFNAQINSLKNDRVYLLQGAGQHDGDLVGASVRETRLKMLAACLSDALHKAHKSLPYVEFYEELEQLAEQFSGTNKFDPMSIAEQLKNRFSKQKKLKKAG